MKEMLGCGCLWRRGMLVMLLIVTSLCILMFSIDAGNLQIKVRLNHAKNELVGLYNTNTNTNGTNDGNHARPEISWPSISGIIGPEDNISAIEEPIPEYIDPATLSKTLVLGALLSQSSHTAWATEKFPEWNPLVYIVDDANATNKVPANKGHEAMVYLTYIIDSYDNLPNITVFLHYHQFSWHIDAPHADVGEILSSLHLDVVMQKGYVNLRCLWEPGCPGEMHPRDPDPPESWQGVRKEAHNAYGDAWEALFGTQVPAVIGTPCCAQFAVTRSAIRRRPREQYEGLRRWLLETELADEVSGRVFEYMWHVIFGNLGRGRAVLCPLPEVCSCELYGRNCNKMTTPLTPYVRRRRRVRVKI